MCGIAGEVQLEEIGCSEKWVADACDIMAHRGPDGEGIVTSPGVAFGHRRLSIIDLEGGKQPMTDAVGRYIITFNGEIYNYRELRQFLENKQYRFLTHSDTEVILNSYAHWGTRCVEHFNGIFAFGLWDKQERTLFLARDHLGVKPLLYAADADGLMFASELKALLQHPRISPTLDYYALSDYLSLGYILTPKTIIQGIRKLPPATWLLWKNGDIRIQRYWELADIANQPVTQFASEQAAVEALHAELNRAVASQLVSDVPVGAFLSGGIDSSAITRKMTQLYPERVQTFSIGFREKSYSELPYARLAANYLGTQHVDKVIAPDLANGLSQWLWYFDEPFADTSSVPTYFLCQLASQHVKVALSGDGGDECFAGYETYRADKAHAWYNAWIPEALHRTVIAPFAQWLPATHRKVSLDYKIKQFIRYARSTPEVGHYSWRLLFSETEKQALWGADIQRQIGDYTPFEVFADYFQDVPNASPLHRTLYVDAKTWLTDAMLVKVDRASMANGLEVRVPLLDYKLVEFAMALPDRFQLNGRTTKYLFKKAMEGHLPRKILYRAKRGFNSPVAHWIEEIERMNVFDEHDELSGIREQWQRLRNEHRAHQADHGFKLWTLANWALWQHAVCRFS